MRPFCVVLWFYLVKCEFELPEYDILYELPFLWKHVDNQVLVMMHSCVFFFLRGNHFHAEHLEFEVWMIFYIFGCLSGCELMQVGSNPYINSGP